MATTIFSVESKHLSKLGPEEGVSLLRDLLWAEARRIGLPPHKIIISLNTTVKDGGIDAKVEGDPSGGSLLVSGDTLFQIKTGASFKPWRQSDLKKELLGKTRSEPAKQLLSEAVNSCLKQGGRYILITLGHDLLPQQHTQAVNSLRDLLLTCGHKRAKIDVIGIGQLLGYLQNLPSLCLELNGRSDSAFQTVARWAGRADMQPTLKLADSQKQFIEQLQGLIRGSEYQHCRVIGEPGLGKTRIVLDAISAGDIRPSTIYVSTGEDLQRSALFNELLKNDREYSVNLVVDDCDEKDRASIWGALKGKPRLKLVTIDHGPEKSSDSSMRVLQLPPLPNEQIEEILGQYTDKTSDLYKWAEWCSGSPRVAHAVGENLKHNPDDILKSPATVDLWDRFILGHKKRGETEAEQHFLVLRHLALFERFGFESPVSGEAEFLAQIITAADPAKSFAITRSAAFSRAVTLCSSSPRHCMSICGSSFGTTTALDSMLMRC